MYISIDPKPIEARIKELEAEKSEVMESYLATNSQSEKQMYQMQTMFLGMHVNDLKKIIGAK